MKKTPPPISPLSKVIANVIIQDREFLNFAGRVPLNEFWNAVEQFVSEWRLWNERWNLDESTAEFEESQLPIAKTGTPDSFPKTKTKPYPQPKRERVPTPSPEETETGESGGKPSIPDYEEIDGCVRTLQAALEEAQGGDLSGESIKAARAALDDLSQWLGEN